MRASNLDGIPLTVIRPVRKFVASVKFIMSSRCLNDEINGICVTCVLGSMGVVDEKKMNRRDKAFMRLKKLGLFGFQFFGWSATERGMQFSRIGDLFKLGRNSEKVMKERRNHVLKKLDLAIKRRKK